MTKLNVAHKKFVSKLQADGKSEFTVIAYNKDIEQIVNHLEKLGVTEVEDMQVKHIQSFMTNLETQNYTPKSISRKTNAARTFIKFMTEEGLLKEDVSGQLKHPKLEVKAPRILSRLEYRALRDAAKDDNRSYAMIEVLLQTGVTISELAGIEMKDLDIKGETGTLTVPKRHNKEERTIPLNKAVIDAVNRYIDSGRSKVEGSKHLFITKTGKPLLVRNIRSTIDRYFKNAGVEKAKVNDLRHTFVAHHLESGVSLLHLSRIAGHKRVSTTERYLDYVQRPENLDRTELSAL